jgi:hypothetical protein
MKSGLYIFEGEKSEYAGVKIRKSVDLRDRRKVIRCRTAATRNAVFSGLLKSVCLFRAAEERLSFPGY